MSVWIESVAIKDLGPLLDKTFKLKRFNLIYGHNETGKTFLVEFLVRSLFRQTSEWMLRSLLGHGKVKVVGLGEEAVDFTPESRKKLEDYWDESDLGLPASMARLIVVKGGELQLAEARAGIDRAFLKVILSRELLLDRIAGQIQKTVQDATVADGAIQGASRGEIKARDEIIRNRNRLARLTGQVDLKYSRGAIRSFEIHQERLEESIAEQMRAKFHRAYCLSEERKKLNDEQAQLPNEDLEILRDQLKDYRRVCDRMKQVQEDHKRKSEASRYHSWVDQAVSVWEARGLEAARSPNLVFLLLGALFIAMGFGAALLEYVIPAILLFILGVGLGVFYLWKLRNQAAAAVDSEERARIASDFKEKFGEDLRNLAQLKVIEKTLRDDALRAEQLKDDVEELGREREEHAFEIQRLLDVLAGEKVDPSAWQEAYEKLRERADEIEKKIRDSSLAIERLGVDESDYAEEGPEVEYSAMKLEGLKKEAGGIKDKLGEASRELENLKQNICLETGDEISEPWPQVLEHLREQRGQVQGMYRQITARILAQIGMVGVLEDIKAQEDEKIRRGLQEKAVTDTLRRVTRTYEAMDLVDNQIYLLGDYANYPMGDLSTGVKEQILLALRMGFAANLAGGEPLFMILDDAFQHSDWVRREKLVEKAADMADAGWQVTYLSMDDHLMELFSDVGKRRFGNEFTIYSLDE